MPRVRSFVRCNLMKIFMAMSLGFLLLFGFYLIQTNNELRTSENFIPPEFSWQLRMHNGSRNRKIEAMDESTPTTNPTLIVTRNMLNSARIRRILFYVRNSSRKDECELVNSAKGKIENNQTARVDAVKSAKITVPTDYVRRKTLEMGNCPPTSNSLPNPLTCRKPLCSRIPRLIGQLNVNLTYHKIKDVDDLLKTSLYVKSRGSWMPRNCSAAHRVAIIIPYRDRQEHLAKLLFTLHPILQRQRIVYRVYVLEQFGKIIFNKGVLMNAGVWEALRDDDFHCFIFHDVDMIPENDRNMYTCPNMPRHLSVAVDKFDYRLPYFLLVGGVFAIKLEHYIIVNGYSNLYWGWGAEDDDMAKRIWFRNLQILRPPETLGRYTMIKHKGRTASPIKIRNSLLRMAMQRSPVDGFNSVEYVVLWKHDHLPYTHLMIRVGKKHHWH